jgi:hypothetical protein
MFLNDQILELFNKIEMLDQSASDAECADDLTVVDKNVLESIVEMKMVLQEMQQRLVVAQHDHRFGTSTYFYLVPKGVEFGEDEFIQMLGNDFEEDRDESVSVETVQDIEVIDPKNEPTEG